MDAKKCDITGNYWTVTAAEAEREFVLFKRLDDGSFQELDVHPTIMNKVLVAISKGKGRLTSRRITKKVTADEPKKKPCKTAKKKAEGAEKPKNSVDRDPHNLWTDERRDLSKKVGVLAGELQKSDPELTRREARKLARKQIVGRPPYLRKGEEERAEKHQVKMDTWKKETETEPEKDEFVCDICKKNPVIKKGYMCPECEQNFGAVEPGRGGS